MSLKGSNLTFDNILSLVHHYQVGNYHYHHYCHYQVGNYHYQVSNYRYQVGKERGSYPLKGDTFSEMSNSVSLTELVDPPTYPILSAVCNLCFIIWHFWDYSNEKI